ncbi:MAG TPA: hypothetical protein VNA17_08420 [Pyrinomonadaceae bacterium]|nr:hypothetical protein [Pyrinomonadaceae bacterium]
MRSFDAATGNEGRTVEAAIAWKGRDRTENYNEYETDSYNPYFTIEYDHEGEEQRVKTFVSLEEWNAHELNDKLTIKYHPPNLEFLVTPETKRESTLLNTILSASLVVIGIVIVLAVIVSLF